MHQKVAEAEAHTEAILEFWFWVQSSLDSWSKIRSAPMAAIARDAARNQTGLLRSILVQSRLAFATHILPGTCYLLRSHGTLRIDVRVTFSQKTLLKRIKSVLCFELQGCNIPESASWFNTLNVESVESL